MKRYRVVIDIRDNDYVPVVAQDDGYITTHGRLYLYNDKNITVTGFIRSVENMDIKEDAISET